MVLLVVDTQNLIMNNDLYEFQALVYRIKILIDKARNNDIEVIYVRHDDGVGQKLTKGTLGYEIYEEFQPMPDERVFDKNVNSAFKGTGLLDYLHEKGENTEALEDILRNAPDWWGSDSKEIYDNLIFIIPPAAFSDVYNEIGEPKKELERIKDYKEVIFWSFSRKDYQKTNWWPKTASAKISTRLTIRTANTVRKIVSM